MPIEPPPSPWDFPPAEALAEIPAAGELGGGQDASDFIAWGADYEPGTLLAAYRAGLFPMPERDTVGWWCPAVRGVLRLPDLRVSRSLRRSLRDFEIRVDTAFAEVMDACGDPARGDGHWIDANIKRAYGELHRLGWAHSVEAWQDGRLVGGLYGVAVGGLFAGESMFHHVRDASKVALVGLVSGLASDADGAAGRRLIDVQWRTDHLASLGVSTMQRASYLRALGDLLDVPQPEMFG